MAILECLGEGKEDYEVDYVCTIEMHVQHCDLIQKGREMFLLYPVPKHFLTSFSYLVLCYGVILIMGLC